LKAFATVVGDKWVLATDEDRGTYSDFYAPGSEQTHAPSAGVAPASAEEVQAVIRLANEHKIPLWPVSRGKNLGYGAAAPRLPGSVVLDLGRMNRILEVDEKLAYCVIEPGVSFFDLQNYIEANKLPLWLSVPGNAWGSVMGNALDRGFGYTPYGLHTNNICGMEVVMPDGDMIRTGMGAMAGNHTWHLNRYGFGPSWDQMFCQSNLGVVTKMGMWLMPEPESSLSLSVERTEEEDIGASVRNGMLLLAQSREIC
jgi:4-cresol dehydrogenase (hydroxylating)